MKTAVFFVGGEGGEALACFEGHVEGALVAGGHGVFGEGVDGEGLAVGEFAAILRRAVAGARPVPAGVFVVPEVVEEELEALAGEVQYLREAITKKRQASSALSSVASVSAYNSRMRCTPAKQKPPNR